MPKRDPSSVTILPDISYVRRGEKELLGDLYLPDASSRVPILVAVHGGGWKGGDRSFYFHLAKYLAESGIAVFAVNYRVVGRDMGAAAYPAAVQDVRAAVQFIRAHAERWNLDTERIGLIGDSAGAHLSALVSLAGDRAPFVVSSDEAYPGVSCQTKVLIGIYGVYDLIAQWRHDQVTRPRDHITEMFLGTSPIDNRHIFHEASPLTYATTHRNSLSVLLIWGDADDVVDPSTQSIVLLEALKQAKYYVRTVVIPDAPHYWITEPLDTVGSFTDVLAPKLLAFLKERL